MSGPLDGLRVLDLTRVLSGPYATLLLADLGAEVWKVEERTQGDETRGIHPMRDGESHYFGALNRNKESLAVDLKDPRGRDLVLELARRADVLIENFRPGVTTRLGLDWPAVQAVNPTLVYCSISAFGQTGPDRLRTAFDVAIQAMGGLMSITGEAGGPPVRAGIPVADLVAGMMADIGVLAALVERDRTGSGQYVDLSMLDGMVSMLSYVASRYLMTGEEPGRVGTGHTSVVPYGAYPAQDGSIVLATLSEGYWPRLCSVLGIPEVAEDPRYATNVQRAANREEVESIVSERLRTHPVAYWERVLAEADIPCAPILSVSQVLDNPQVIARGMVRQFDHPRLGPTTVLGSPLKFSSSADPEPLAPPLLGEHTATLLGEVLGLSAHEVETLVGDGVVRVTAPTPVAEPS